MNGVPNRRVMTFAVVVLVSGFLVDRRVWTWPAVRWMAGMLDNHLALVIAGVAVVCVFVLARQSRTGAGSNRSSSDGERSVALEPLRVPWVLSDAGIAIMVVVVAVAGTAIVVAMLRIADHPSDATERAKLQVEALKYGLGFIAAAGAVAALLLAVRRQRLSERGHEVALETHRLAERNHQVALKTQQISERNHQLAREAQAHTQSDAAARRVTDLYTKAVEQLGSADAAVRLGGLYALERVAQENPVQRQTIVNVLCAYLRMPYTPATAAVPDATGPVTDPPLPTVTPTVGRDPQQELQVRLTAQRILTTHLTLPAEVTPQHANSVVPEADQPFWPGINLDLTGAHLVSWHFNRAHVGQASFTTATFTGAAWFSKATFTGTARFADATFTGIAGFANATFANAARFDDATFTNDARFDRATFTSAARFDKATFMNAARFDKATFTGTAHFAEATFNRPPRMEDARVPPGNRRDAWPAGWQVVGESDSELGRLVFDASGVPG
jgi:hypothetical protein